MAEKFLRGKAPLTVWRGANGSSGGQIYRGGIIDPRQVDVDDRKRLIGEGSLELVVRDGESFTLAEDTDTDDAGTPVTIGDADVPDPDEPDPGTVNTAADTVADPELETRRAEARAKLPADGSAPHHNAGQAVWVEYLAAQGGRYEDLSSQDKADLQALAKARQ